MKKVNTISYQNRHGIRGDLPAVPKILLANHLLTKLGGFNIGDKVTVQYSQGEIIIKKIT